MLRGSAPAFKRPQRSRPDCGHAPERPRFRNLDLVPRCRSPSSVACPGAILDRDVTRPGRPRVERAGKRSVWWLGRVDLPAGDPAASRRGRDRAGQATLEGLRQRGHEVEVSEAWFARARDRSRPRALRPLEGRSRPTQHAGVRCRPLTNRWSSPRGDGTVELSVWGAERPYARRPYVQTACTRSCATTTASSRAAFPAQLATKYLLASTASRRIPTRARGFQPHGVRGPSEVVDSSAFEWTDSEWQGVTARRARRLRAARRDVLRGGTFAGVIPRLAALRSSACGPIEVIRSPPFPAERGWGYDPYTYAPHPGIWRAEGFARLVDAAHANGLAVLLASSTTTSVRETRRFAHSSVLDVEAPDLLGRCDRLLPTRIASGRSRTRAVGARLPRRGLRLDACTQSSTIPEAHLRGARRARAKH